MTKNNIIIIIIGILILVGLFWLLKPKAVSDSIESTPSSIQNLVSAAPATTDSASLSPKTFDLVVQNQKIVSGPKTITVKQGDYITITIIADKAEEVHLHGYDKSVGLEANQKAELSFKADITGRFPFELEKSGIELGVIEVQP